MATVLTTQIEAEELGAQFSSSWLNRRTPFRTPGIHTSDIISDLVRHVPSLAKTLDMEDETKHGMWLLGLAWEDIVRTALGWQGFEVTCDDIVCNPDIVVPTIPCVDECKLTWKSIRRYILDDWRWMTQVKTYCYALGVDMARFWVYHVNGNYAPPQPIILRHDIRFTEEEIVGNWLMMQTHLRYMQGQQADVDHYADAGGYGTELDKNLAYYKTGGMGGLSGMKVNNLCSYCGLKPGNPITTSEKLILFQCEDCKAE